MKELFLSPSGSQSPAEEPVLKEGFPTEVSGVGNPPAALSHLLPAPCSLLYDKYFSGHDIIEFHTPKMRQLSGFAVE
ncbi:hypothetical protein DP115_32060 [Brasilonema octagenarum UFV-OR1]|uniref:Uncharacterized protein n=1 Tax=Brasilonema octagenarum UFV-OR1 TaxID=417115 RepID=A0ABX1MEQ5_9CYAN|nr:hypothetical protein [Brasilonema octagenarum UFV-OR1]